MSYRQLHDGDIQVMKELRANGWSLEGIARIYRDWGVTVATVEWLVGERAAHQDLSVGA
jgi:hypothetical protein